MESVPGTLQALAKTATMHIIPNGSDLTGNSRQMALAGIFQAGHRGKQRTGVCVARVGKQFFHPGTFNHTTGIHNNHTVTILGNHTKVMRNQHGRRFHLFTQFTYKRQYLLLYSNVECRGRFICDNEFRATGQSHCYDYTLAHATGKRSGKIFCSGFGVRYTHEMKHVDSLKPGVIPTHTAVQHESFGNLVADTLHGIESPQRFLKNNPNLPTPHLIESAGFHLENIFTIKKHPTFKYPPGGARQQAHQAHGGHTFTTATLPHYANTLPTRHAETHIIYRTQQPHFRLKGSGEVMNFKQVSM